MKFNVKDEDGKEYTVEEVETTTEKVDPVNNTETKDDESSSLSAEEIGALKGLAAVADKLVALVNNDVGDGCEEEEVDDSDEDEDEEEVIDTAEEKSAKKMGDAKKSVGAIEKKKPARADDSIEEDEVANAWTKRYNGGK